ncbi:MAG: sel1 repeat family protein [Candidatus Thioglobus sp.]|nr:sel1 repeat family protein [Candidatus Thioglobus sp.]
MSWPGYANNQSENWYQTGFAHSLAGRDLQAFEWMLKAANSGYAPAQNNVGLSFLHGLGVEKNDNKAFAWFKKAAKQNLPDAQNQLAILYENRGKPQQAYKWWLAAARQNDEFAQFNLAVWFLQKNHKKKAYYWFKKALENQHSGAAAALNELDKLQK